jgi:ADP-ribose pyrophosphatase YjhB (NUDIX family)
MFQKIYFQNKPLYLTDSLNGVVADYLHQQETLFLDELNAHTVDTMVRQLEDTEIRTGVFYHADLPALLDAFKKKLTLIQAAGGLVLSGDKKVLLIFRLGKWDLPKGKLEEGEELSACALRETEEETGLKGAKILQPLPTTYHTYHRDGQHVLKESLWFLMKVKKTQKLTPQTEEDIEKCEWAEVSELRKYMDHMHRSVADVIQQALPLLH